MYFMIYLRSYGYTQVIRVQVNDEVDIYRMFSIMCLIELVKEDVCLPRIDFSLPCGNFGCLLPGYEIRTCGCQSP